MERAVAETRSVTSRKGKGRYDEHWRSALLGNAESPEPKAAALNGKCASKADD